MYSDERQRWKRQPKEWSEQRRHIPEDNYAQYHKVIQESLQKAKVFEHSTCKKKILQRQKLSEPYVGLYYNEEYLSVLSNPKRDALE